jgi:hypothetical protein
VVSYLPECSLIILYIKVCGRDYKNVKCVVLRSEMEVEKVKETGKNREG